MKKIGLTTTVPVEVIFAANCIPVDLNNIFVTDDDPQKYINSAEVDGFPRNICAWIKALYSVAVEEGFEKIVGVTEGDCSNTESLIEVWNSKGIETVSFGFPKNKKRENIEQEIDGFMDSFGVSIEEVERVREKLKPIRENLKRLDELTWRDNKVSGFENHLWQVSSSDFNGDYRKFSDELDIFLKEIESRDQYPKDEVRIGYIGVPPIITDIYDIVEENNSRVVYNEVQRAFTMSKQEYKDIYDMYLDFTYPYDLNGRLEDIKKAVEERKLDAIVHYVQSFCHRGIEDIIIKSELDIPVLTVEGDLPGSADARTKLRLESFLDMLADLKGERDENFRNRYRK